MLVIYLQVFQNGLFEKIIEIASQITNPISLIAFGIALIPVYFLYKDINDKKALKDNPQEYLRINERIQIDIDKVLESDRPPIIKQVLQGRIISQSIIAGSIIIGGLILAWIVTHVQQPKPQLSAQDARFVSELNNLLVDGAKIRTRIIQGDPEAFLGDDCIWIDNATEVVKRHIKETSESNLLIYLEKMEEIHCGQTTLHEDGGVETSRDEIPKIMAYCQTTVEQHMSILQNIKAVIE